MRRTGCRPGINDVRCKNQTKPSQFDDIIEDVNVTQQSRLSKVSPAVQQKKKDIKKETDKVLGVITPSKIAKATQKSLTEEQIIKAKLVKASSIFNEEGTAVTVKYLKDNNLNYEVDWLLSNDSSLVLIDNSTGEAVVSYRGTDLTKPSDWITALDILRNEQDSNETFKEAKVQMEKVIEEYGVPSELLGFSRGGTIAMSLGNEFGVNTTTFNPFVNKSLATTLLSDAEHTIVRTTTDAISIGANLPNPKFKTIQIDPKANSLNPLTNHGLDQFLDNDSPRRTSPLEKLVEFTTNTGKAHSELLTLKDMVEAINEGKSFSDFLTEFSPVDIRSGELSTRIYEGSNFTEFWKNSGGEFDQVEQAHLDTSPKGESGSTATTEQHQQEFAALSSEQQGIQIDEMLNTHMSAVEKLSSFNEVAQQVQGVYETGSVAPGFSENASTALAEQFSGAGIAGGLIGGYIGNKAIQELDPNQKLGAQGDELSAGFIAGGVGAALAGGALLPAAAAGALGMLAGSETSKAIQKAGGGKEAAGTGGGAVGGATAGAAIATLGALGAVATGAEFGAAFAPETFGISIAVGAAVGGIFGLASALWDDVFGDDPSPTAEPAPLEPFVDTFVKVAPIRSTPSYQGTGYAPQPATTAPAVSQPVQATFASRPLPPPRPREMTSTMGRSTAPQIKPVLQLNAQIQDNAKSQANDS